MHLYLRPMREDDATMLFEWQSHPDTRRYANNPEAPRYAEHEAWIKTSLGNPDRICFVVEPMAGFIRMDRHAAGWLISVYVNPEKYRQGVADYALSAVKQLYGHMGLVAQILPGNRASLSLFRKSGFERRDDGLFYFQAGESERQA